MKKVTEEEYREFFKNNEDLRPIASFSDPEGTCHFGYGVPTMDTDWGISGTDEPLARCQMRKDNRHSGISELRLYAKIFRSSL